MDAPVCSSCGAPLAPASRFCGSCGAALDVACPGCGIANPFGGAYCTACGRDLRTPEPEVAPVDRGERKTISVLFADVVGYTRMSEGMDPEDVRTLMGRAFGVMQEEIHRFEGVVSQFLGDGLLALFGAPIAYEDHAQRSISAGLAIQDALDPLRTELAAGGLSFAVRIGINSGPVVFGPVGTDLEHTLQATGDTTNTAQRAQGLAEPGAVVVTASAHRLAEGYFLFRDLGAFEVKNKAEPLHVFQAIRSTGSRSRVEVALGSGLAPLIGREAELVAVMDAWERARAGAGQMVVISGEPGIGKSRLLHEVRSRLDGEEAMWLTGRCISYGAAIAYVPIVDLIKDACGIDEGDGEDAIITKLEAGVADVGGNLESLPYLRTLLSVNPGDTDVEAEEPALRKAHIFEAFRDVLLSAAARRPVVLAVEDLHWIDGPSAELLSYVGEVVPDHRVLLLLTHRADWSHPFGERSHHVDIRLSGLTDEDALDLAQATLGVETLSPALREAVASKTDGNPFFVEEVARALSGAGGDDPSTSVPDTVQGVIMARLDRLPDQARSALQTASVIGREFTARLLERTASLGAGAQESLHELKATQLIFERSLYPELVYMFKHALTHDVAYASLLRERRRALHGLVADTIVDLYADRLPELYEIVATHYERAERWTEAERYLMLAAHKSMAAWAVEEAAGFAERALGALARSGGQDADASADIHEVRATANEFLNRWTPACESYTVMAELASVRGDADIEASAMLGLGLGLLYAHRFDEALEVAGRAQASGEPEQVTGGVIVEAYVHTVEGRIDHVLENTDEIERAAAGAKGLVRGLFLCELCEVTHWIGDEHRALTFNDEAVRHASEGDSQSALWSYWDRGLILPGLGRYEEALAWLERHIELCRRVGDVGFWSARSMNTTGWTYMQVNAFDEGRAANEEGLELARRMGDPEIIRNAALNLADCALAEGDASAALGQLAEVEAACDADSTRGAEWMKWRYIQHLWASLADAHLAMGEAETALGYADRCLADARRTRTLRYLVRGLEGRARALGRLGRDDDAIGEASGAVGAADEIGSPTLRWRARLVQADLLREGGRSDAASAVASDGLDVLNEVAEGLQDPRLRGILLESRDAVRLREGA